MIRFIALLLTISLFTACSDDDNFQGTQEDLTGTWVLNRKTISPNPNNWQPSDACPQENLVIPPSSNSSTSWTFQQYFSASCFMTLNENLRISGIEGGSENFIIEEFEDTDFIEQQSGKFLNENQIQITQEIWFSNISFTVESVFDKQ